MPDNAFDFWLTTAAWAVTIVFGFTAWYHSKIGRR
jgi:ABC-type branched-subunit amino acid transport system permease subunit